MVKQLEKTINSRTMIYREKQLFDTIAIKRALIIALPIIFLVIFFVFQSTPAHGIDPLWKVLKPPFAPGSLGKIISDIWQTMMNLVNSLVLIALVYVAFMNILRVQLDSYAVKKILPTFIMAVILANFSFLISRIVIDFGSVAISIFLLGDTQTNIGSVFDGLVGEQVLPPGSQVPESNYFMYTVSYDIKQLMAISGSILVFILAFIFLIRNYMIYFLVAIAPIAFMAMVLPMTKKYFQQWWSNMFKWVFMPVVSVFWLWLAGRFASAIEPGGIWIIPLGFVGLCFYMAITSPFKIGGAVVSTWAGLGKKAWGATGGRVTKWAGQEAKERASDVALRARLKVARTETYQKTLGDKSAVGKWRTGARSARAVRRLRLEGPQMVREKQEKDAKIDAAYSLANDKRTPLLMKRRMISLIRADNLDERKTYDNWGLQALLDDLKFNADGTLVTSNNNDGSRDAIDKKKRYTEEMRDQMAKIEQIKYLLRRRNQLDPAAERPIADNLITGNPVTINGVPRALEFLDTSPESRGQPAVRNRDIRRLDPSGFGSSAVPMQQTAAPGTQAATTQPTEPEGTEAESPDYHSIADEIHAGLGDLARDLNKDTLAAAIASAMQKVPRDAKGAVTPDNVGLVLSQIPEIRARISGAEPEFWTKMHLSAARVANKQLAAEALLHQQSDRVVENLANLEKQGLEPQQAEPLIKEGEDELKNFHE